MIQLRHLLIHFLIFSEIRSNSAGAVYNLHDRSSLFGSPVLEQDESSNTLSLELTTTVKNRNITVPTGQSPSFYTNEEVILRPKATPAI